MSRRSKNKEFCLLICGSKQWTGIKIVEQTLKKILADAKDNGEELLYIVMGNNRESEKVAYKAVRKLHLKCAILPADFERHGINAEVFRNGSLLAYFKPKKILMLHETPEDDPLTKTILRWARGHDAIVTRLPVPKKNIAKKV